MKFYKASNGKWKMGRLSFPAGKCSESIDPVSGLITISELGTANILVMGKLSTFFQDANGNYYADLAAYEEATSDFFVDAALAAAEQLAVDLGVETQNRTNEDANLQNQINTVASGYLGSITYNAPAPTPAKNGWYDFSTGGVVSWLTGTPTVKIGDRVSVLYTNPTYTYTYQNINLSGGISEIAQVTMFDSMSKSLNFGTVEGVGITKIVNSDNSIKLKKVAGTGSSWLGVNLLLDTTKSWTKNHNYYIALDCIVNTNSLTEGNGINTFNIVAKNNNAAKAISNVPNFSTINTGLRGVIKSNITVTDINNYLLVDATGKWAYIQFGSYLLSSYFDIDIYKMYVIDLTLYNLTYSEMDSYVSKYGLLDALIFIKEAKTALYAEKAKVAESAETLNITDEIDVWGDSLVAQNWASILGTKLGRTTYTHGFGGKKSTYVRDQFLASTTKSRTQIINVGRNNYSNTETVIDDIKRMVSAIGHRNFLICTPPNGIFSSTGEIATDGSGSAFLTLEKRLSNEYGANYLNTRLGTIYTYNNGGITLLSAFTQPSVGGNVQISVSDANFLNTHNANDITHLGATEVNKIVIGINGIFDIYEIISIDSSTLMTIKLINQNRITSGNSVTNLVDDGGTSSIVYLRVMQNADYYCLKNEITQSTFRSDGIHMSALGLDCIAEVVARKIVAMKI